MVVPDTWAHRSSLFVVCACLIVGFFSASLPVFCGPITMNFGNLSQVFSLDQMSLCRLSSHGFYITEKKGLEVKAIMHILYTETQTCP